MTQGQRPSETKARIEQAFARTPISGSDATESGGESLTAPQRRPSPLPGARGKTYRLSVDVDQDVYRQLRTWSAEHELRHVDVIRSLLAELQEDPVLMERVLRRLD